MQSKGLTWILISVGSFMGSWIPTWFGLSYFSPLSIILSIFGAGLGVWVAYKLPDWLD